MLSAVYRLLSSVLPFVGVLNAFWRSRKEPAYRVRIKERFGFAPASIEPGAVWLHAVSAGELIAAEPIIHQLLASASRPRLLITTTTPTGSNEVKRRFGQRVDHCYMPYDASRCIRRFIQRTKPIALILMETEIWPNLLRIANNENICVCLANARLSERSANRYGYVASLTRHTFQQIGLIVSQYEDTTDRFIELGYPANRIHTTGTTKFDVEISSEATQEQHRLSSLWLQNRTCWIAASTHPGEDVAVLDAQLSVRQRHPNLGLIVAPRHPHRAQEIVELAQQRNLSATKLSDCETSSDVLIVDQMGVLLAMYSMANIAFIGGSLQGTGGHNPIEAAVCGLPMLMGPDRHNFEEVSDRFKAVGCLMDVRSSEDIAEALESILQDDDRRIQLGQAAQEVVRENRGATQRQFQIVADWLNDTGNIN